MTKKKSNSWARMKLLLLLPVAALSVYACARPDVTRQLEQMIRSENTTPSSNNPTYTSEFFEAELNKFISELGGSPSLSADEKYNFLAGKTNVVNLFVNARDHILLAGDYCTLDRLASDLTKQLVAEYSNKKPALIYMFIDRGTSADAKTEIFNIVGKIFDENKALLKQKNQPVLLLYGNSRNSGISASISVDSIETHSVFIAFMDDSGKELRSFILEKKYPGSDLFAFDHAGFFNDIKEWLKSLKGERPYTTVAIKASTNTPMGIITDLKVILRNDYGLRIEHR